MFLKKMNQNQSTNQSNKTMFCEAISEYLNNNGIDFQCSGPNILFPTTPTISKVSITIPIKLSTQAKAMHICRYEYDSRHEFEYQIYTVAPNNDSWTTTWYINARKNINEESIEDVNELLESLNKLLDDYDMLHVVLPVLK